MPSEAKHQRSSRHAVASEARDAPLIPRSARDTVVVSVVLITWNSAPYLRRCLAGIAGQTHRDLELIVVDNASSDESLALVPDTATIIRNAENRGFAAAANQGIAASSGELVALVNPDCFFTRDYIANVIAAMNESDVGSATGTLYRAVGNDIEPSTEIDSTGIRMTHSGRHLDMTNGAPASGGGAPAGRAEKSCASDAKAEKSPAEAGAPLSREVFGVSGAAGVYRMSFLRDVAIDGEIFDEDFFAYREDADLAWRGRLFGWRALHVPTAVAYHVRRVTPEKRGEIPANINMHSVKNRFLLRLKNEGLYLALRNFPFELLRDLIVIIAVLTVERSSLPALAWLWKNRRRVMAKRREIQRRRRVSDRTLAVWFR